MVIVDATESEDDDELVTALLRRLGLFLAGGTVMLTTAGGVE